MHNECDKAADVLADVAKASENVALASMDQAAKFDPPDPAREYVQTTAEIAKGRAADTQASAGKVSHALEGRMMQAFGARLAACRFQRRRRLLGTRRETRFRQQLE